MNKTQLKDLIDGAYVGWLRQAEMVEYTAMELIIHYQAGEELAFRPV